MNGLSIQSNEEQDVRPALSIYKLAPVRFRHGDWWNRLRLWCGDRIAAADQARLVQAEAVTRHACNLSDEHRDWVRLIAGRQQEPLWSLDNYEGLIPPSDIEIRHE